MKRVVSVIDQSARVELADAGRHIAAIEQRAQKIIERITTQGHIAGRLLTLDGEFQLLNARGAVNAATAALVNGIEEGERQTTRTVLDTIRYRADVALDRAEAFLTRASTAGAGSGQKG